jgi:hypothetical protein
MIEYCNPLTNICHYKSSHYPLRNLSAPCNKHARGLLITWAIFARGLPYYHTKGQSFNNTSEEYKIKTDFSHQEEITSLKPSDSSPILNNYLSFVRQSLK